MILLASSIFPLCKKKPSFIEIESMPQHNIQSLFREQYYTGGEYTPICWFDASSVTEYNDAVKKNLRTWNIFSEKPSDSSFPNILRDKIEINKTAFKNFVKDNLYNPKFRSKYVVFVDGVRQDVGNAKIELVKKTYAKFGNVPMYVGQVSQARRSEVIKSPKT